MATHDLSWHSVNKVTVDKSRKCISNYYFSSLPLKKHNEFHVTTFKGRPNQKLRNAILNVDNKLRMGIRKLFKKSNPFYSIGFLLQIQKSRWQKSNW